MLFIDLTQIRVVVDNHELAISLKEALHQLKLDVLAKFWEFGYSIIESGAFVILEESLCELIKNSKDAGATTLSIPLELFEANPTTISISVVDNGTGFDPDTDSIGPYPIHKDHLTPSSKLTDPTKMGGKNTGNVQASFALHQNGGALIRSNICSPDGKILGAKLIFRSSLAKCRYSIDDYQTEFCTPSKKQSISAKDLASFLSKPLPPRGANSSFGGSSFGRSYPTRFMSDCLSTNDRSTPSPILIGASPVSEEHSLSPLPTKRASETPCTMRANSSFNSLFITLDDARDGNATLGKSAPRAGR